MKFLDQAGVGVLWNKVKDYTNKQNDNAISDLKGNLRTINGTKIYKDSSDGVGNDIKIDLTLWKVCENGLPSENIDTTKIYLVKDSQTVDKDIYSEYMFVNGKWEKLGDFRSTVDLAPYSKTEDTASKISNSSTSTTRTISISSTTKGLDSTQIPTATSKDAGLMSAADRIKLDGIADHANNYTYTLPVASTTALGGIKITTTPSVSDGKEYPIYLKNQVAYVHVPWVDTNTTYGLASRTANGLMSAAHWAKIEDLAALSSDEILAQCAV